MAANETPDSARRWIIDAEVVSNVEAAPGHHRMRLRAPEIASAAQPGQFCMLQTAEGLYPFLRRPMCFARILPDAFEVLFKVEGEGTRLLARMRPGHTLNVQGPLGNGFPIEACVPGQRHIVVAGGIGVATFPAFAEALIARKCPPPQVVLAARTAAMVLLADEFRAMGCAVHVATDDGSAGLHGFAHDALAQLEPGPGTCVYACGPMRMMRATAAVAAQAGAASWVSLEAQMACGDGVCLGCVVESRRELEGGRMVRVCCEGPVFEAATIDWEAHDSAYDR